MMSGRISASITHAENTVVGTRVREDLQDPSQLSIKLAVCGRTGNPPVNAGSTKSGPSNFVRMHAFTTATRAQTNNMSTRTRTCVLLSLSQLQRCLMTLKTPFVISYRCSSLHSWIMCKCQLAACMIEHRTIFGA